MEHGQDTIRPVAPPIFGNAQRCVRCGAKPGEQCQNEDGTFQEDPHWTRREEQHRVNAVAAGCGDVIIESNTVKIKPSGPYGAHLDRCKTEFKQVMMRGFPSGYARDMYAYENLRQRKQRPPVR